MKYKSALKTYKYIRDKVLKNHSDTLLQLWNEFIQTSFYYARFISDKSNNTNRNEISVNILQSRFLNSCSNLAEYFREHGLNAKWFEKINKDSNDIARFACYIHCICGIESQKEKVSGVKQKNRTAVIVGCLIMILSALFITINQLFLHSFLGLLICSDLIALLIVPCISFINFKSNNENEWNSVNRKSSIIGYMLVAGVTIFILGLHFRYAFSKPDSLLNSYIIFTSLPRWVIAFILCIVAGLLNIPLKAIIKKRSKYFHMDAYIYSKILFTFSLCVYCFIFGIFYIWLMSLFVFMFLGTILYSSSLLGNFSNLITLISNIKKNGLNYGSSIITGYIPMQKTLNEESEREFALDLSDMDNPVSNNKSLITCAPYSMLENYVSSSDGYKYLTWNLDLLIIDQNEKEGGEFNADNFYNDKMIKSIESPRTCVLLLKRYENPVDFGYAFAGSALEQIIIPRIVPKDKYSNCVDEVRIYVLDYLQPLWKVNSRLFRSLSVDQFRCLDWILSNDIAPVSGLMIRLLRTSNITERYYILLNFCEAQMRFFAALALSAARTTDADRYDKLKNDITVMPSFGKWVNLIREYNNCNQVDKNTQNEFAIIDIWCKSIEKTDSVQKALNLISDIIMIDNVNKKRFKPIDFYSTLVTLRNKTVGHGVVTFKVAETLTHQILSAILDIAVITYKDLGGEILWRSDSNIFSYNGVSGLIFDKLDKDNENANLIGERTLVYKSESFMLNLQPWIYRDTGKSRLMFFNGYQSNRVEYLSYESGSITEPHVEFLDNTEEGADNL